MSEMETGYFNARGVDYPPERGRGWRGTMAVKIESEREIKAREEGKKWEIRAVEFLKEKYPAAVIREPEGNSWRDIDVIFPNGAVIPYEVKKIREKRRNSFIRRETWERYSTRGYSILKLIKENHEQLKAHNGRYLIFVHNGSLSIYDIPAAELDFWLNHDEEDIYKRYYGISVKRIKERGEPWRARK